MTFLNLLYRRKTIVTLVLWIVLVVTVVLNIFFNLDLYSRCEDYMDDLFNFNYCNDYDTIQNIPDISVSGKTVVQKMYINSQFNELWINYDDNYADNINFKARLLMELSDPKGKVIWSKKGKVKDVLDGFRRDEKYFNVGGNNNGVYTLKITPLDVGTASPVLIRTCYAPGDNPYVRNSELTVGNEIQKDRFLEMWVAGNNIYSHFGFYNNFAALLIVIELALIIAWQIIKHKIKKREKQKV